MAKRDAMAELSTELLAALRRLREQGPDVYPLTLPQLARMVEAVPPAADVAKALKKKPLADESVIVSKKHPETLIALKEDAARLAADDRVLRFALGQVCTAAKPLHPLARVVGKVEKPLQPAFKEAIERRVAEKRLPSGVGVIEVRGKAHLFLEEFPPPKPPHEQVVARMVAKLEEARGRAWTLPELVQEAAPGVAAAVLKKALGLAAFKSRVALPVPRHPRPPVFLREDAGRALAGPAVLGAALELATNADNQAATAADLVKKVDKVWQPAFREALASAVAGRALPPGVGLLRIKKKDYLFVAPAASTGEKPVAPPASPAPAADFPARFDDAFARLDREAGGVNFVSLVPLRKSIGVDRAAFDAGLRQLRQAGRYTLSPGEGRHGYSPEEQEAGVVEGGVLLLYVSRR